MAVVDLVKETPVGRVVRWQGGPPDRQRSLPARQSPTRHVPPRPSGAPQHHAARISPRPGVSSARASTVLEAGVAKLGPLGKRDEAVPLLFPDADHGGPAVRAAQLSRDSVAALLPTNIHALVQESVQPGSVQRDHRLLQRHVDPCPSARRKGAVTCRQPRDRCVPPGIEVSDLAAELNGGPIGKEFPSQPAGKSGTLTRRVEQRQVVGLVSRRRARSNRRGAGTARPCPLRRTQATPHVPVRHR